MKVRLYNRFCRKQVRLFMWLARSSSRVLNALKSFSVKFQLCPLKCKETNPACIHKVMKGDANMVKSCVMPQIKPDVVGDDRWGCMHRRYVVEAKTSEAEVLFLGDSIIQQLQFTSLWDEKINSLHCLNFGIGGDRVEHVLWRIFNGELDFTSPVKAVVLLVGTNNTDCAPEDIFNGICEIIKVIKLKLGNVIIILPTLLPRGQYPNANRERNLQVNALLLKNFQEKSQEDEDFKCDSLQSNIYVVPIHEDIIQSDQTISHHIMHDYLHLTNQGYSKIFKPVYEKLLSVLRYNDTV